MAADGVDVADDDVAWIRRCLEEVVLASGVSVHRLDLILIDDATMAKLHGDFLDKPETTDVLTFDLRENEESPIEGEVYACIDEARRCIADRSHPVRAELLLYGVHGLLHLAGHDDHDPDDHRRMHEREDELLRAVGVGSIYDSKKRPS